MDTLGGLGFLIDKNAQWEWLMSSWPYSDRMLFVVGTGIIHSAIFWGLNIMFYFLHVTGYEFDKHY